MALKKIKADLPETKKAGSDIPTFAVQGDVVTKFNQASIDFKDAEARLKAAREPLLAIGSSHFFAVRCAGTDVSSVKLTDTNGAAARFTFQDRYSAAAADPVDAVMTELGEDINDWVAETVKPSFDTDFFTDKDGNFDQKAYELTVAALDAVSKKLGKSNPLSAKKVVVPKPVFHEKRFSEFSPAANAKLTEVLPNTRTLTPIVAKD